MYHTLRPFNVHTCHSEGRWWPAWDPPDGTWKENRSRQEWMRRYGERWDGIGRMDGWMDKGWEVGRLNEGLGKGMDGWMRERVVGVTECYKQCWDVERGIRRLARWWEEWLRHMALIVNQSWQVNSVWCLHVLPCFLSEYSNFFPQSKNMHARLIGDFKLTLGVSCLCVSVLSLCCLWVVSVWPCDRLMTGS